MNNVRRSLTFKWMVTLLLTSLVGVVLVGVFAYRTTASEYDRLRVEQSQSAFVENVTEYYQANGNWTGVEAILHKNDQPETGGRFGPPQLFALANAQGVVVAECGPFHNGELISSQELASGIAIEVDGERVGTGLLALPPPELDPREQEYLDGMNRALIIGAFGASAAALLIGILLSRLFLRPLTELTHAITAMRQGDYEQKVQVRSQDELGALAQTFNEMRAEIQHANHLRKQMTADIAHDLRTPLNVISGYLEALQDGTLQPTPARFEAMSQEAQLLKRLVEDLRTLSLADAGELKLVYQSVPAHELLEQVQQSFEPLALEQGVKLHVEADASLPNLRVDRERMVQVLANLVANALRYTPGGGAVTLVAQARAGGVQIAVRDTGSGIPADKLPNIFERFYRIEESRVENQGESGLGLAIAKSIVEAHQGTIAAESLVGAGTSITITLKNAAFALSV
jgi:signal transduction histidine kinase